MEHLKKHLKSLITWWQDSPLILPVIGSEERSERLKRALSVAYDILAVLALLLLVFGVVQTSIDLGGWSLPPFVPALPWSVVMLADVLCPGLYYIRLRRGRLRKQRATPSQPAIYQVGSPEYNAQVVEAIRSLNERLAPQGKRVPERVAIEIIQQVLEGGEQ